MNPTGRPDARGRGGVSLSLDSNLLLLVMGLFDPEIRMRMPIRISAIRSLWRMDICTRCLIVVQTIATIAIQANQGIEFRIDTKGCIVLPFVVAGWRGGP